MQATLLYRRGGPHSATADIILTDASGSVVARLDGYECVVDEGLVAAFAAR